MKEDFRRARIEEIGSITFPSRMIETYTTGFEKRLNTAAIQHSNSKVVIDYVYAVSGAVLPQLLNKFGCDAVVLNASLSQTAPSVGACRRGIEGKLGGASFCQW